MVDALWTYGSAALSGGFVALLLTLFGGGGSVLATPLLLYVVGVRDPHVAIGTSAAAVAVNAAFGLSTQARAGHVKWPCAIVFGAAGLAGTLTGAHLAKQVDGQQLLAWFALAMALVGLSMLRRPRSEGDPAVRIDTPKALRLAPVGLATGLAAGFFGIGGGFLIVPALIFAAGLPIQLAIGTSLLVVAALGATTATSYAISGMVAWPLFGLLVLGGAAGSLLGARIGGWLLGRKRTMELGFAMLVIGVGVYVAAKAGEFV